MQFCKHATRFFVARNPQTGRLTQISLVQSREMRSALVMLSALILRKLDLISHGWGLNCIKLHFYLALDAIATTARACIV